MSKFVAEAKKFVKGEEDGATMVEYGLMLALIAIVCIVIKLLLLFLGGVYCRRVPLTRSPCRRFQR